MTAGSGSRGIRSQGSQTAEWGFEGKAIYSQFQSIFCIFLPSSMWIQTLMLSKSYFKSPFQFSIFDIDFFLNCHVYTHSVLTLALRLQASCKFLTAIYASLTSDALTVKKLTLGPIFVGGQNLEQNGSVSPLRAAPGHLWPQRRHSRSKLSFLICAIMILYPFHGNQLFP